LDGTFLATSPRDAVDYSTTWWIIFQRLDGSQATKPQTVAWERQTDAPEFADVVPHARSLPGLNCATRCFTSSTVACFKEIFHAETFPPVNPSQPSTSEHPCRETTVCPVIVLSVLNGYERFARISLLAQQH
jgi:hypothetical protein